ncbi:MAG: DUF3365 domain-containing protein [Mongoliibacter sp.]|uniref:Tll0287-like domain-containing protein n=1 Tax=Mongoliibacter sp. TaxID=2022438 RepID=UPI0012F43617|nr:DUF3365 domain-containing protein [Mongoliibacter sp.]TVP51736.1 MAG: DUF3365 domain-containing protein [Mongoliibacter sp.]
MRKIFYIIPAIFAILSCGSNERVSKEVFDEVNKSMKVTKVNEAELIQAALKWGDEISQEAQEALIGTLQEAIAEKGVTGAIEFCNVQALPILQEVSDKYDVQVRRASFDYRNPEDAPKDFEAGILDTYVYNMENGLESEPNVQKFDNGDILLFTKAIKIPSGLCLNCHGEPGKEIAQETLKKIDELYPEDKAKGHKIGDLRGMWSIRMPKKEVVKRMGS